jgi:hypothetical protein
MPDACEDGSDGESFEIHLRSDSSGDVKESDRVRSAGVMYNFLTGTVQRRQLMYCLLTRTVQRGQCMYHLLTGTVRWTQ